MATKEEKIIKIRFYFFSLILLVALVGAFILGFKLDYFGNTDQNYPVYKSLIFYGYALIVAIYTTMYAKFSIKHDRILSKKRRKKTKFSK